MFAKFKGALINAVGNLEGNGAGLGVPVPPDYGRGRSVDPDERGLVLKFKYSRPQFLQLTTDDEIQVTADHIIRPIIVPRDFSRLPWNAGYAECINAGKSVRNEDQASVHRGLIRSVVSQENLQAKVADMMPIAPAYPRQNPVKSQSMLDLRSQPSQSVPGRLVPVNGHSENDVKEATEEMNGNTAGSSNKQSSEIVNGEKFQSLSVADLLSPSEPLPISDLVISPSTNSLNIVSSSTLRPSSLIEDSLPWVYFGIFDGHAGPGVAVAAANQLHKVIQDKLQNVADLLIGYGLKRIPETNGQVTNASEVATFSECDITYGFDSTAINRNRGTLNGSLIINHSNHLPDPRTNVDFFRPSVDKLITVDNLIVGALESSFWEMDSVIATDKQFYKMPGGCTALAAVFILGKLYVVNAGDSRCILYKNSQITPMSFDFTPESERERIKMLGLYRPELLGSQFTHLEYIRRPTRKDLGRRLLYRDAFMTGWSYKTITHEDLKFPLVFGEGKRSRVLATIGVTRGFGDHELTAQCTNVLIKPFLTPQPEVRILDLTKEQELSDSDVIIMGTDGLWDVTSNEKAVEVVQQALDHFPANDVQGFKYRYISAAQDLVMTSRGKQRDGSRNWRTTDNKAATIDDISVFVIPLKPYQQEFLKWKDARDLISNSTQ